MSEQVSGQEREAEGYFLGSRPSLYDPRQWQPADEIQVSVFRQILLWPLALRTGGVQEADGQDDARAAVRQVLQTLEDDNCRWERLRDLSDHATPNDAETIPDSIPVGEEAKRRLGQRLAERYSEFVFFHDFIQDNLFGRTETEPGHRPDGRRDPKTANSNTAGIKPRESVRVPPITLFRRRGRYRIQAMAGVGTSRRWYEARIERFNLYVFATGAAMLALELDLGSGGTPKVRLNATPTGADAPGEEQGMALADAQDFADLFRRAYPPYFTPRGVAWPGATEDEITESSHEPLVSGGGLGKAGGVLRHVSISPLGMPDTPPADREAMPADPAYDLWHAHANVRDKTGGDPCDAGDDWSRAAPLVFRHWREMIAPLVVAGTPEEAAKAPFEFRQVVDERIPCMSFIALASDPKDGAAAMKKVSRGDWMRLCFADSRGTDPLPYSHHFVEDFEAKHCYDRFYPSPASSICMTRYLCSGYHFVAVGAGDYFEKTILGHFRRHYFQLGLAVNVELASLLTFSGRASEAVKELNRSSVDSRRAARLFGRRMRTLHRDFLQFVHLFRFTSMSNQVQPSELFDLWRERLGLSRLYEDVKGEIESANDFLFANEAAEQTEASAQLSVMASIGVVLGLAFAFLSLAVFFEGTTAGGVFGYSDTSRWRLFCASTFVFSGAGMLLHIGLKSKRQPFVAWLTHRFRRSRVSLLSEDPVLSILGWLSLLSLLGFISMAAGPLVAIIAALVLVVVWMGVGASRFGPPET